MSKLLEIIDRAVNEKMNLLRRDVSVRIQEAQNELTEDVSTRMLNVTNDMLAQFLIEADAEDLIEVLMEVMVVSQDIGVLEKIEHAVAVIREGYEDIKDEM